MLTAQTIGAPVSDVFISYASADREQAGRLAHAFEALGWSVWWDRKIITGQVFDQAIEHELDTARSVVVLWSPIPSSPNGSGTKPLPPQHGVCCCRP